MSGKRFCGFLTRTTIALAAIYLFCKPLLPAYNRILTAAVNPIIQCCVLHPDKISIATGAADIYVETLNAGETVPRRFALDNRPALFPLIFLSALLLSACGMPGLQRLKHIAIGAVLVFLFQVFSAGLQITALFSVYLGDFSSLHYSDFQRETFLLIKNFNHGIGQYAFPFLYWAVVNLRFRNFAHPGDLARVQLFPCGPAGK